MDFSPNFVKLIDALAWPALLAWGAIYFKSEIRLLINRVVNESAEISIFGVSAKFAEAKDKIAKILESQPGAEESKKDEIVNVIDELALSQLKLLATHFYGKNLQERIEAARGILQIGAEVSLKKLIDLAQSESPGERAAAAIALRSHLQQNESLIDDPEVNQTLRDGLCDERSRVRYRFVQLASTYSSLVSLHKDKLFELANDDGNEAVSGEAARTLGYY